MFSFFKKTNLISNVNNNYNNCKDKFALNKTGWVKNWADLGENWEKERNDTNLPL